MSIFRNLAILATCCASSLTLATTARADLSHATCTNSSPLDQPHNLIVFPNAYFPRELYVQNGDTIKFHNKTGFVLTVPVASSTTQLVTEVPVGHCQVITFSGTNPITMDKPILRDARNGSGKQGFIRVGAAPNQ